MRTLLIVDDEVLIAEGLRGMLAREFDGRLDVLCRYSGAAALQEAKERPIDILLTDINMPGITGLELHRSVQTLYPGCLAVYLTGYSDFDYARTALDQRAFAYILKGEGDDVVVSTVERALERLEAAEPAAGPGEKTAEGDAAAREENRERVAFLQEYITGHLNEELPLKRLAEVCHLHPVYLSRIFKETAGITVGDYINAARRKRAEDLLKNSRLTVLEISRETGFATDNYFCRWFKKKTGMSPEHYRRQNRQERDGAETERRR